VRQFATIEAQIENRSGKAANAVWGKKTTIKGGYSSLEK